MSKINVSFIAGMYYLDSDEVGELALISEHL